MSFPPSNTNARALTQSRQVPPNTPIYKEFAHAIARDQDDLGALERLVTRLNNLGLSNSNQPSVPRRPSSASDILRKDTGFSSTSQLHRPGSVPPEEGFSRTCSYVHPVVGKVCEAWFGGANVDEYFSRHVAQHYLEEMALATLDHLDVLYTRHLGFFQQSHDYVFACCSCGIRTSCQTNNPARLFLLDPYLRNSMCHTCLLRNFPRFNNDLPPPYKRQDL